jgi:large subunit ribosomal protein L14
MIQSGTFLNVIDNSGAKKVHCIKVLGGYRKRYGHVGNILVVAVKSMRRHRQGLSKIKKGDVVKALIVRTKNFTNYYTGDKFSFFDNSVVLLTRQHEKLIGTRIFGGVPRKFRYSSYLRIASLSAGLFK